MLKKITVDQLQLGMHLHELCGAWMDHPFWKTKFVLSDPADLAKLRASGVADCWIDSSKGLDVASVNGAMPGRAAAAPVRPDPYVTPAPRESAASPVAPATVSMADEVRRAARLCNTAREAVTSLFNEARMGRALDTEKCLPLVDEIASSVWRNPGAIIGLARLKNHDDYTYMHSVAVCALMVALARRLGMDDQQAREAGMAGLLHDMGKAAMPLALLTKPGKLSAAEYEVMKQHPLRGHEMLLEGGAVGAVALDVCLHHHERPDGRGYPHGLAGPAITHQSNMGAVCDVYDAITSNRPYKSGWGPAESIAMMATWTGAGQFDPAVFHGFVKSLGIYPIGSLVRMQSGRLAVVVDQNDSSLVAPLVKVFFSTRSNLPIEPELLDLSSPACSDRIVGRESNAKWKFIHLDALWAGADVLHSIGK